MESRRPAYPPMVDGARYIFFRHRTASHFVAFIAINLRRAIVVGPKAVPDADHCAAVVSKAFRHQKYPTPVRKDSGAGQKLAHSDWWFTCCRSLSLSQLLPKLIEEWKRTSSKTHLPFRLVVTCMCCLPARFGATYAYLTICSAFILTSMVSLDC